MRTLILIVLALALSPVAWAEGQDPLWIVSPFYCPHLSNSAKIEACSVESRKCITLDSVDHVSSSFIPLDQLDRMLMQVAWPSTANPAVVEIRFTYGFTVSDSNEPREMTATVQLRAGSDGSFRRSLMELSGQRLRLTYDPALNFVGMLEMAEPTVIFSMF